MRLLVDENLPRGVFDALITNGHDARWIGGETGGLADEIVLALAQSEKRTIVTFDMDFGKLIIVDNLPGYCGVILLRVSDLPPTEYVDFIMNIFNKSNYKFIGYFTVVKTKGINQRPLNGGPC